MLKQWNPRSFVVVFALVSITGLAAFSPEIRKEAAIALTAAITGYFAAEQPGNQRDP